MRFIGTQLWIVFALWYVALRIADVFTGWHTDSAVRVGLSLMAALAWFANWVQSRKAIDR